MHLAEQLNGPETMAVDGTHVYWTDPGPSSSTSVPTPGTILRVPLAGGTPENLAGNTIGPFGIAVDDTNVYWVEQFTATSLNGGRVLTIPKAGATPTVVAADQLEPFRGSASTRATSTGRPTATTSRTTSTAASTGWPRGAERSRPWPQESGSRATSWWTIATRTGSRAVRPCGA